MGRKLTQQQWNFCREYVACGVATKAAITAGYSPKGADSMASQLLGNPKVEAEIARLRKEAAQASRVTTAWITEKWIRLYRKSEEEGDKKYMSVALDKLGAHIGYYREDNLQRAPLIQIGHVDPDALKQRLAAMEAERDAKLIGGERVVDE